MESITLFFSENLSFVVFCVAGVAVVALVFAVVNAVRLRSIIRPFAWVSEESSDKTDTLPMLLKSVENISRDVETLKSNVEGINQEGKTHFKRMGLVRYDAFDGIAGQQSYSLCLLDDKKNGVLISSLVGKDFARSYAIEIAAGAASRELGDEEGSALDQALNRGTQ